MLLIFIVLVAHVLEIWLFAFVYFAFVDYAYFSSTVYTTLGFGISSPWVRCA